MNVRVALHPEVSISVRVNVARTVEEAERQARGEVIGAEEEEETPVLELVEEETVSEAPAEEEASA